MRRKIFSLVVVCLIVLSLLPIMAIPVAAAAGLTLSAGSGPVGTSVTLTGAEFTALSTVTVTYDGAAITTNPATVTSEEDGSWTATVTIPASTGGSHTIAAADAAETPNTAQATFTVDAEITVAPTTGTVGTSLTITGTGFGNAEQINFSFAGNPATPAAPVTSGMDGSFTATSVFNVPASTAGDKTVAASDGASNYAEDTFTVTSQISISPASGTVGTTVDVTGDGFPAGAVVVLFDGTSAVSATADASGNLSTNFSVPDATAGEYEVTTNPASTTEAFTVTPELTGITPALGPVDTPVDVTGTGFPEGTVQILFNGDAVGSGAADDSGKLTGTFDVPDLAPGVYPVTTDPASTSVNYTLTVPQISIDPPTSPVGTTVSVTGSGFAAGETDIAIIYDGAPVQTGITADSTGGWTGSFEIPHGPTGAHIFDAAGQTTSSLLVADQTFAIIPEIQISQPAGPVGTTVGVAGTGFAASELSLVVTWNGALITDPVNANASGSWQTSFIVPLEPSGSYTIDAFGLNTLREAVADLSFEVTDSGITIPPPNPTSGAPGTAIVLNGVGFGAGETGITVTFAGDVVATLEAAEADGAWSTTFPAPDLLPGTYIIDAYGDSTPAEAVPDVPFTLEGPAITVDPLTGPVDTEVTVNGVGFAPDEEDIEVLFDGVSLGLATITARADGSWTATFDVPSAPAGDHGISARGLSTPEVLPIMFNITPSMTIDPTEGPVGTGVELNGLGFNPGANLTVTYDGTVIPTREPLVPTDPNGSWTNVIIDIPPSVAGEHIVAVGDGTHTVEMPFTVEPSITLDPAQGPVGTMVLVSGSGFAADEPNMEISFNGAPLAAPPIVVDGAGSWVANIAVPDITPGAYPAEYAIYAAGDSNSASETFTLTKPTVTVDPTSGPINTAIIVSATGFMPGETGIAVFFDEIQLADGISADDAGEWTAPAQVPLSSTGAHTITAQGDITRRADVTADTFTIALIDLTKPVQNVTADIFYSAIQPALDAASPNDIIAVYPKPTPYNEAITIATQVWLVSTNGADATTISASPDAVTITADNTILEGFTITGASGTGVKLLADSCLIVVNIINGNGTGIFVDGAGNRILKNDITGNVSGDTGIHIAGTASDTEINWNDISGNIVGIANESGLPVDAMLNWWGDASGPNPPGFGDGITGEIIFSPWLGSPRGAEPMTFFTRAHDKPMPNIQAAIDAAADGDTVLVYPGYYHESIYINKYITVKSLLDAAVTTIDGEGEMEVVTIDPSGGPIVVNGVPPTPGQVVFDGFTVTNGETGIEAVAAGDVRIINNIIALSDLGFANGILISGTVRGLVQNNTIDFNNVWSGMGILLLQSRVDVLKNEVNMVSTGGESYGIVSEDSESPPMPGPQIPAPPEPMPGARISDNVILIKMTPPELPPSPVYTGLGTADGKGIQVTNGAGFEITGNSITIDLENQSVDQDAESGVRGWGISIAESQQSRVSGNTITLLLKAAGEAKPYPETTPLTAEYAEASGDIYGVGIEAGDCQGVEVTDNDIRIDGTFKATALAVLPEPEGYASIYSNVFGVIASGSTGVAISGNSIEANTSGEAIAEALPEPQSYAEAWGESWATGIYLYESPGAVVTSNPRIWLNGMLVAAGADIPTLETEGYGLPQAWVYGVYAYSSPESSIIGNQDIKINIESVGLAAAEGGYSEAWGDAYGYGIVSSYSEKIQIRDNTAEIAVKSNSLAISLDLAVASSFAWPYAGALGIGLYGSPEAKVTGNTASVDLEQFSEAVSVQLPPPSPDVAQEGIDAWAWGYGLDVEASPFIVAEGNNLTVDISVQASSSSLAPVFQEGYVYYVAEGAGIYYDALGYTAQTARDQPALPSPSRINGNTIVVNVTADGIAQPQLPNINQEEGNELEGSVAGLGILARAMYEEEFAGGSISNNQITVDVKNNITATSVMPAATNVVFADAFAVGIRARGLVEGQVANNGLTIGVEAKGTAESTGENPEAIAWGYVNGEGISVLNSPAVKVFNNTVNMNTSGILTSDATLVVPNLVQNPGFEEGMEGWTPTAEGCYDIDSTVSLSGASSLKGALAEPGAPKLYQDLTGMLDAEGIYELSGWIKTENVTGQGAMIVLRFVGPHGELVGDSIAVLGRVKGTSEWTKFVSFPFEAPVLPPDGTRLLLVLAFGLQDATGTAWWDDISLKRVDEEALAVGGLEPYRANSGLLVRRSPEAQVNGNTIIMNLAVTLDASAQVMPAGAVIESLTNARAIGISRSPDSDVSGNTANLNMTLDATAQSIMPGQPDFSLDFSESGGRGMVVRRSPGVRIINNDIAVTLQLTSRALTAEEPLLESRNATENFASAAGLIVKRSDGAAIKFNRVTVVVGVSGASVIFKIGEQSNLLSGSIGAGAGGILVGHSDDLLVVGNTVNVNSDAYGFAVDVLARRYEGEVVTYWQTASYAEGIELWDSNRVTIIQNNAQAQARAHNLAATGEFIVPPPPMPFPDAARAHNAISGMGQDVTGQWVYGETQTGCSALGILAVGVKDFTIQQNSLTADAEALATLEAISEEITASEMLVGAFGGSESTGIALVDARFGGIVANAVTSRSNTSVNSIAGMEVPGLVESGLSGYSSAVGIWALSGKELKIVKNNISANGTADATGAAALIVTRMPVPYPEEEIQAIVQDTAPDAERYYPGIVDSQVSVGAEGIGISLWDILPFNVAENQINANGEAKVSLGAGDIALKPGAVLAVGGALNSSIGIQHGGYMLNQAEDTAYPTSRAIIDKNIVNVVGNATGDVLAVEAYPEPEIDSAAAIGASLSLAWGVAVYGLPEPVIAGNMIAVDNSSAVNINTVERISGEEAVAVGISLTITQGITAVGSVHAQILDNKVNTLHQGENPDVLVTINTEGQAGQLPVDPAAIGIGLGINIGIQARGCPGVEIKGNNPVTAAIRSDVQTGASEAAALTQDVSALGAGLSLGIGIGVYQSPEATIARNRATASANSELDVYAVEEEQRMGARASGSLGTLAIGIHVADVWYASILGNNSRANASGDMYLYAGSSGFSGEYIGTGLVAADAFRVARGQAANMSANNAKDSGVGIRVIDNYGTEIHGNNITGNTEWGVFFQSGGHPSQDGMAFVQARPNWWGDLSGPSGMGPGSGDAVGPYIAYSPWLTRPVETVAEDGIGYYGVERYSPLLKGWNILSTPIMLENNRLPDIIDPNSVQIAYRFNAETKAWELITSENDQLNPLDAVYAYAMENTSAKYAFSPELSSPPARALYEGWNLVGPAPQWTFTNGFPVMSVQQALQSLNVAGNTAQPGYAIVVSPPVNQQSWAFTRGSEGNPPIIPFEGYWVFMENEDVLAGFSATPIGLPLPYVP